jgi:hypothetical protein
MRIGLSYDHPAETPRNTCGSSPRCFAARTPTSPDTTGRPTPRDAEYNPGRWFPYWLPRRVPDYCVWPGNWPTEKLLI